MESKRAILDHLLEVMQSVVDNPDAEQRFRDEMREVRAETLRRLDTDGLLPTMAWLKDEAADRAYGARKRRAH